MSAAESGSAPLTAAMIRRAPPPAADGPLPIEAAAVSSAWREDVRLFAITWAAGFVFFLAFLA